MKTGFIAYGKVITLFLWLSFTTLWSAPFLQPKTDVDLNLFALRLLENLRLPQIEDSYEQSLAEHQRTLVKYREFFAAKEIDEQILTRFDSALELSRQLQEVIKRGLEIEQQTKDQKRGVLVTQAISSSARGIAIANTVPEPITAITAAGGHYLWNVLQQFKTANRAEDSLIDAEVSKFTSFFNECFAKNKATAALMTDKYGWKPGEAGFTTTVEDRQKIDALYQTEDLSALEQLTSWNLKNRPNDPFAINDAALIRFGLGFQSRSVAEILRAADMFIEAANLFPSSSIFIEERATMLFSAAHAQTVALFFQSTNLDFQSATQNSVEKALALLGEYQHTTQFPPRPVFFEVLSCAAAHAGVYKEALQAADQAYEEFQGTPSFHLNCARMASRAGDQDRALSELKRALNLDVLNIRSIKSSPDFTGLATSKSKDWEELFEVKYTWQVDWGFFNDDVLLRNDSHFALTEVVFAPKITTKGQLYAPILTAAIIPPGKVYRWANVFSIPGSRADDSESRIACAESEANLDLKK